MNGENEDEVLKSVSSGEVERSDSFNENSQHQVYKVNSFSFSFGLLVVFLIIALSFGALLLYSVWNDFTIVTKSAQQYHNPSIIPLVTPIQEIDSYDSKFEIYENEELNISFQYPSSWTEMSNDATKSAVLMLETDMKGVVVLSSNPYIPEYDESCNGVETSNYMFGDSITTKTKYPQLGGGFCNLEHEFMQVYSLAIPIEDDAYYLYHAQTNYPSPGEAYDISTKTFDQILETLSINGQKQLSDYTGDNCRSDDLKMHVTMPNNKWRCNIRIFGGNNERIEIRSELAEVFVSQRNHGVQPCNDDGCIHEAFHINQIAEFEMQKRGYKDMRLFGRPNSKIDISVGFNDDDKKDITIFEKQEIISILDSISYN